MLGYTPRQAQFLVLVALHGGYFLRRQYVAFTGTPHGQATVRFLDHAVTREHVHVLPYGRQGHVFHLYARPLYAAIGEEDRVPELTLGGCAALDAACARRASAFVDGVGIPPTFAGTI
jgi:hypothetical protein